jgi:hypothetical protein
MIISTMIIFITMTMTMISFLLGHSAFHGGGVGVGTHGGAGVIRTDIMVTVTPMDPDTELPIINMAKPATLE